MLKHPQVHLPASFRSQEASAPGDGGTSIETRTSDNHIVAAASEKPMKKMNRSDDKVAILIAIPVNPHLRARVTAK